MVKTFKFFAIALTLLPVFADAANLNISPSSQTIEVGDRLTLKVVVSGSESINAVSGELSIPTNLFSIESVSKFGSILNFWVSEPSFSNSSGKVSFEGVALGGFQGGTGSVVNVSLRAKAVGNGRVEFVSGQVLANDGQGTNVTQGLSGGSFVINEATRKKEPEPASEPEPAPAVASLLTPQIVLVSKYGEKAVSGTSAYPESEVVMMFINKEGVKVFVQSKTDSNGQFLVLIPKTLKRGEYDISAQVVKKDLTYSPNSNIIKVNVGNILSDLGNDVKVIFILLFLIVVYSVVRIYRYIKKNREIKRETHEAKEVIKKSFKILHEDVNDILGGRKSVGDRQEIKEVIDDLDEAESVIEKELKDIEKL